MFMYLKTGKPCTLTSGRLQLSTVRDTFHILIFFINLDIKLHWKLIYFSILERGTRDLRNKGLKLNNPRPRQKYRSFDSLVFVIVFNFQSQVECNLMLFTL